MRSRAPTIWPAARALTLVSAVASFVIACATSHEMHSAAAVPAAHGTVDATEDGNGNTSLRIKVEHLAPPSKIAPDATVYVVWIEPRNAPRQNVGALALNDELEGSLDTVTPHRRFRVVVTPEPSAQVAMATHQPVFTADVEPTD
jgi:hypothetical protein